MSLLWVVVSAIVVLVVGGGAVALGVARGWLRRQIRVQQAQSAEFADWARAHGYAYAEVFPDSEAERTRGLAALLPFSDFALQRAHHVFYDTTGGSARFVLQLTVYSDAHADAPPRGALTVAVAEVPGKQRSGQADVRRPAQRRGESNIHAHGRWVTSYVSGPLTFDSMETVTAGLERHLGAARGVPARRRRERGR